MLTSTHPVRLALALASVCAASCETADPTLAVLDNAFSAPINSADQTTVYKGWWSVTEFPDPVGPGQSSEDERVIPARAYAYLLLAPGWNPSSPEPPTRLIPVRTKSQLSVERGDRLQIVIADDTIDGNCTNGSALSQDEADFITQRIFPGEFAGRLYDAATCATKLASADAVADSH